MECPKCSFEQPLEAVECRRCGVIFEKYRQLQDNAGFNPKPAGGSGAPALVLGETLKEIFFFVLPETNPVLFGGRLLFFLVLVVWGVKIMVSSMGSINAYDAFWHLVNLPFHEFGHILFTPLGRRMTSLGGSISQVLMPLICMAAFLIKTRDTFAAAFALWWAGTNFIDLAPYINDARSLTLPLLGGNTGQTSPYGFHDWEFILTEMHLLPYDHVLARLSSVLGMGLMVLAMAWGGFILLKQYRNLQMTGLS